MKRQLTLDDIYQLCLVLKTRGYNLKTLPVYLGDDLDVNNIHYSTDIDLLSVESDEAYIKYYIKKINDNNCKNELKNKGILIS